MISWGHLNIKYDDEKFSTIKHVVVYKVVNASSVLKHDVIILVP